MLLRRIPCFMTIFHSVFDSFSLSFWQFFSSVFGRFTLIFSQFLTQFWADFLLSFWQCLCILWIDRVTVGVCDKCCTIAVTGKCTMHTVSCTSLPEHFLNMEVSNSISIFVLCPFLNHLPGVLLWRIPCYIKWQIYEKTLIVPWQTKQWLW